MATATTTYSKIKMAKIFSTMTAVSLFVATQQVMKIIGATPRARGRAARGEDGITECFDEGNGKVVIGLLAIDEGGDG